MRSRSTLVLVSALVVGAVAIALVWSRDPARVEPPTESEMATSIGTEVMRNIHRGHVEGRSGDIYLVPKPHHFLISRWTPADLAGEPAPGSTHSNPWDYLTKVPIVFYGSGVAPGVEIDQPTDITSLAPTLASSVDLDMPQASPALDVIDPSAEHPRAIVVVVIDGGGWNVLQEHPSAWPNLRRLMEEGSTFTNAHLGSAPSITGALHANFGTGTYPQTHGIPAHVVRDEDGSLVDAYFDAADPRFLRAAAFAELWDEANGNRPTVGTVSFEGWHLGMIGSGAARAGGDKDIAVLWQREEEHWWVNEDFYKLPDYLSDTDIARLEAYEEQLDHRDGILDGKWFGHTTEDLRSLVVRPGTPAFARFTGDAVIEIFEKEDVGGDALTDIFWIEMKMPDYAGHTWNAVSPETEDVLRETDEQIGRFVQWLTEKTGEGGFLFAVSADHGQQPLPELHGGWRINTQEVLADIEEQFGDVVEKVTPVDIFLDYAALDENDVDPRDIARFLGKYTVRDSVPDGAEGIDLIPPARLDDRVFAGAFSGGFLQSLDDAALDSFGDSEFPEGDI